MQLRSIYMNAAPRSKLKGQPRDILIRMTRVLPLAFLAGFAAEITSIIWVGQMAGVLGTLLLMALGVLAGAGLLRRTGVDVATALRQPFASPDADKRLGVRVILSTLAALLFIVPGFFSDLTALLLLLPPVQGWIGKAWRLEPGGQHGWQSTGVNARRVTIIDAKAVELTEKDDRAPKS